MSSPDSKPKLKIPENKQTMAQLYPNLPFLPDTPDRPRYRPLADTFDHLRYRPWPDFLNVIDIDI